MTPRAAEVGRLLSKNSRTQNVVYPGLLAATVAYAQHAGTLKAVICYCLLVVLYAIVVSINNVADLRTDTLNQRDDNPLVDGRLSAEYIRRFVGVCLVLTLVLQSLLVQPASLIISLAYLLLGYTYSSRFFRIQARGLWATLLLCCCYGAIPALLGLVQGRSPSVRVVVQVTTFAAIAAAPAVLAKDYKDLKGDTLTGKLTPLVRYGKARLHFIAGGLTAVALLLYVYFMVEDRRSALLACVLGVVYIVTTAKTHRTQRMTWLNGIGLKAVLLLMPLSLLCAW